MDRLLTCTDDCFVENLVTRFCRFRKASFGGSMDGRAVMARVDVWSDRVQVRAGRSSISMTIGSFWQDLSAEWRFLDAVLETLRLRCSCRNRPAI
jgi:hypothetical protein